MCWTDLKELMKGFGNQLPLVAGKMPNCMETGWFCIVWQPLWGRGGLVSVLRDIDASSLAQLFHRIHACYNQLFLAVVPTISSSSQIMYFLSLSQHPHKMISNMTNFAKEGVKIPRVDIRRQNILGGQNQICVIFEEEKNYTCYACAFSLTSSLKIKTFYPKHESVGRWSIGEQRKHSVIFELERLLIFGHYFFHPGDGKEPIVCGGWI